MKRSARRISSMFNSFTWFAVAAQQLNPGHCGFAPFLGHLKAKILELEKRLQPKVLPGISSEVHEAAAVASSRKAQRPHRLLLGRSVSSVPKQRSTAPTAGALRRREKIRPSSLSFAFAESERYSRSSSDHGSSTSGSCAWRTSFSSFRSFSTTSCRSSMDGTSDGSGSGSSPVTR
jgi:hypothetical protein